MSSRCFGDIDVMQNATILSVNMLDVFCCVDKLSMLIGTVVKIMSVIMLKVMVPNAR
jgi:hypothetical protein